MGRKASVFDSLTQRSPISRISQASQVYDHVLPAVLHLGTYLPLHEVANIKGRSVIAVAGSFNIPVLACRVGAVSTACCPEGRGVEPDLGLVQADAVLADGS